MKEIQEIFFVKLDVITTKNRMISDEMICVILIIPGTVLLSLGFFGCSSVITQIPGLLYCVRLLYFFRFIIDFLMNISIRSSWELF